jgi:hypothetical protein
MPATVRLELRLHPDHKRLIEEAATTQHLSVNAFVLEAAVRRSMEVLGGREERAPRPIGGWSFSLPEGWDGPLGGFEDFR